jgi:hypothetical protein
MKLPPIVLVLSLTLGGCAAHRAPAVAPGVNPLHDWASVAALPRGAPVRVTLAYDIGGSLEEVTDSTLTILVPPGMAPLRTSRADVVRVAVLTPKKMRWRWLGTPLVVGVLGGLAGMLVGAVMWDGEVAGTSFAVFTVSSIGAFLHIVHHLADHEWRPVYVRP